MIEWLQFAARPVVDDDRLVAIRQRGNDGHCAEALSEVRVMTWQRAKCIPDHAIVRTAVKEIERG